MCVIFFAYKKHPEYPLILLANRDEFYERPTAAAAVWPDAPQIFAGRDLARGGTWLGITPKKIAAVTNYRDPLAPSGKFSRGDLVSEFLKNETGVAEYLSVIQKRGPEFSGFNLLTGEFNSEIQTLGYYSNRENRIKLLGPGVYGLSNSLLDTPWPKVEKGKSELTKLLENNEFDRNKLFGILADKQLADDAVLPDTGIGYEREKLLSSIFIETPVYGTRSSSLVLVNKNFEISLEEVRYL